MKNRKVDHLRQKINYINSKATNENHLAFINVFAMDFVGKDLDIMIVRLNEMVSFHDVN